MTLELIPLLELRILTSQLVKALRWEALMQVHTKYKKRMI